jgi:hypothetical protein
MFEPEKNLMNDALARRRFLRHTLATLAYRAEKPLRDAPEGFATFQAHPGSRTPAEILAHMCDLFDWALSLAHGEHRWHPIAPTTWDADCARFFAGLRALDACLADETAPLGWSAEAIFQGPIADALTHTGQLSMLRRMAGAPVRGENYARADIRAGRVGRDHPGARVEFE